MTKINRGIFFEAYIDTDFTIFNHYIIEVMPEINKFYDNLIDVALPRVLEELINNPKLSDSTPFTKYNYFKENDEELVNIQCICFSIQDVLLMVKHLKPKLHLFKNTNTNHNLFIKSVEKISNQEIYLNQVLKLNTLRNFFLVFNVENNPEKMEFLFPKVFRFTLSSETDNKEVLLTRIKFCIKRILRCINLINHKVYAHLSKAFTTQNFFIALNQILQLEEFTETEFNDNIPLNWYSLYMTSNLHYLSEEYIKNDYEKLYNELLKEEKEAIELLNCRNNLIIAKFGMNNRCVEKINEKVCRDLLKVKQIEKFLKMEKFIKNSTIKVCVRLNNKDGDELNTSKNNVANFFDNIFFWNKRKSMNESNKNMIDISSSEDNP